MAIERPITHPDPAVSVVIPTIPEYELKTLSALQKQTEDQFEVVVVSDASLNRCEARNKGIEEANAEVIAQTDDDCYPPEDWVERIRNFFDDHPEKVLLEGPLDKLRLPARHYIGANMAYRRKAALDIGGFDSEFAGWRADTDFGWRMEDEYGVECCHHDPELEVVHDGPTRTNVDREKEQKFRSRYPKRYFTVLYYPNIPFGRQVGLVVAMCYQTFPKVGEILIKVARNLRP
ncbi:glycosyltransferase involved in cell wall biosynthesis [Halorubrum trapanicum]|uniref:Glycosyltransferase involved in cell wall biosynthesis n=1 Tax=Halorubrum trapanicum TaxID=29284 RepID=A0A8J7RAX5_9EURY|nr:glycosyltransferase family A protein [Halorubrum trapanicum]MBP1902853.1 glycosyltransferase involved in cell wall biosynthesis [Halorubrum trapanicum]